MGIVYTPDGAIGKSFLRSRSAVRLIQGPIESGKSTLSAMALYSRMCTYPRGPDGLRRTKFLAVRNTYPDLESSTVPTFLNWFPEDVYGKMSWGEPYTYEMKFLDVRSTVVFRSFADDGPDVLRR